MTELKYAFRTGEGLEVLMRLETSMTENATKAPKVMQAYLSVDCAIGIQFQFCLRLRFRLQNNKANTVHIEIVFRSNSNLENNYCSTI